MNLAEIQKQVEYYLGDLNLAKDDFFRELITKDKDGYIDMAVILKCNKVKKLGVNKPAQIAAAIKNSTLVEVSKDQKRVRRTENPALPTRVEGTKKREVKAEEKKQTKDEANGEKKEEVKEGYTPIERDELGRVLFTLPDFENTSIVHFKTTDIDEAADADYKVSWKDLEVYIKEHFDQIKVVYSRADKYEGDLAVSTFKLHRE
jgi:hypothetical protein